MEHNGGEVWTLSPSEQQGGGHERAGEKGLRCASAHAGGSRHTPDPSS